MARPTELVYVANPIVAAGARVIASPFQFYVTGEDHLLVSSYNSAAGVTLKIQLRWLTADGTIQAGTEVHTPNTDRTLRQSRIALAPGALLNVVVYVDNFVAGYGQTYVIISLIRGLGSAGIVLGTLLQGSVATAQSLAWPGAALQNALDGQGFVRAVVGTAPALGSGLSETVPTGARWELDTLYSEWTLAAGFGTTTASLWVTISGDNYLIVPAQRPTTAGSTAESYSWHSGAATVPTGAAQPIVTSLPTSIRLPAGAVIHTTALANAQWSAPRMLVREWLDIN